MIKSIFLLLCSTMLLQAQSYAPAAGQPGSTAIPANSSLFVGWATGVDIQRGHVDISNPELEHEGSNYASYGTPEAALGMPTNSIVSLGDAGEAILTFDTPIGNGAGFDFAIFENSFSDTFLELAFVEVSSDGVNFFRFPSHSETQTDTQVGGFGNVDPTYINNLAGKYRGLFGTPFDLSDISDDSLLDKNSVTHVKIIDVVGSIDPLYARYDSFGNAINDPFTTPFYSGGFDLDAVGVINQQILGVDEFKEQRITLYPNPAKDVLYVKLSQSAKISLYDTLGKLMLSEDISPNEPIDVTKLQGGFYLLMIDLEGKISQERFIKQ